METLDLHGKRTMIRLDLNVPLKNGAVISDARIMASLPTIQMALDKGANVILLSHLGRPDPEKLDGRRTEIVKDFVEQIDKEIETNIWKGVRK